MIKIPSSEKGKECCQHAELETTVFKVIIHFITDSPKKKIDKKYNNAIVTPSTNRKDANNLLPPSGNKNLPPKPVYIPTGNNQGYKLPPKPVHLVTPKQNNSVDYSRPYSSR